MAACSHRSHFHVRSRGRARPWLWNLQSFPLGARFLIIFTYGRAKERRLCRRYLSRDTTIDWRLTYGSERSSAVGT